MGSILDPWLPSSALHGLYCFSHDFIWLENLTLEKQTSQLSLVMPLWIGSVWMYVAISWANTVIWNRLWNQSVFHNPVTHSCARTHTHTHTHTHHTHTCHLSLVTCLDSLSLRNLWTECATCNTLNTLWDHSVDGKFVHRNIQNIFW